MVSALVVIELLSAESFNSLDLPLHVLLLLRQDLQLIVIVAAQLCVGIPRGGRLEDGFLTVHFGDRKLGLTGFRSDLLTFNGFGHQTLMCTI